MSTDLILGFKIDKPGNRKTKSMQEKTHDLLSYFKTHTASDSY